MTSNYHYLCEEADLDKLMLALLSADLIVDSIYGVGFKGKLNEFDSKVIKMVNCCQAPVVAVDIPSGLEADTVKPMERWYMPLIL